MPLNKVFRLGPTQQRITKGYLISGDADRVQQFLNKQSGREASGIQLHSPGGRILEFRTSWVLMADPTIRAEMRDSLVAAVLEVGHTASQQGLRLLPSATRPKGARTWSDWTCGDRHEISIPSTTELEIVSNAFRASTGLIVALTGRSAIEGTVDRTHSARLLHSTDQLYARYVTSASPRNLKQVSDELRRTSGIRSLDVMDVYPGSDGSQLVCTVKAIDAQAFVDTTLAHALLVQALAMRSRRSARHGSRIGRMPDQLLQKQRLVAITEGLAGRVRLDVPKSADRSEAPVTSFEVLARDLSTDLLPEFGSLQATFAEISPVLGWTVDGSLPRNENEFMQKERLLTADALADAISRPDGHQRFSGLGRRSQIAAQWENLSTEPPTQPGRSRTQQERADQRRASSDERRPSGPRRPAIPDQRRPQHEERPVGGSGGGVEPRSTLARLKEADEQTRKDALAELIAALPDRGAELVPWDPKAAEAVKAARAAARPPGPQRRTLNCSAFSATNDRVARAVRIAGKQGWSLLSLEGTPEEIHAVMSTLRAFLAGLEGCQGALLGISKFKDDKGTSRARAEVVLVGTGEAR